MSSIQPPPLDSLEKNLPTSISEPFNNAQKSESLTPQDLIGRMAMMTIGLVTVIFMYKLLSRGASTPLMNRVISKGLHLKESCYQAAQNFYFTVKIHQEIDIWIKILGHIHSKKNLQQSLIAESLAYHKVRKAHAPVEPAAVKLIEELFVQHIQDKSILELGSNILDSSGDSYLARLLPHDYLPKLKYSDCNPEIVHHYMKGKTGKEYLQLDATCLSKTLAAASESNIVAINVFDTIARNKLDDVVKETHTVLRNGGKLVVLCDMPFNQSPLFEKYSTKDNFVMPYREGNNLGVTIVSKKALIQNAQKLDQPFVQFIQKLVEMPPSETTEFLFLILKHKLSLIKILESICEPKDYVRIDHKQSYIDDLTDAFKSHGGFDIQLNDYKESEVYTWGTVKKHPHINVVGSDLRMPEDIYGGINPTLEENKLLIKTVFHVLIAKKQPQ